MVENDLKNNTRSVYSVATVSLRTYLTEEIDILKIDIEGLELEIVKAIPQNRLAKIKMIQYETWPKGIVTLEP